MRSPLLYLHYLGVRTLLAILQGFPFSAALRFGSLLGLLAYKLASAPRKRAIDNLRLAYGGALSEEQVERITRGVFDVIGRHLMEVAHMPRRRAQGMVLEHPEIMTEAYARGKGVILVSVHMGCFGRLALVPRLLGIPASVIMKKQTNERLHRWAIQQLKRHCLMDVLLKNRSVDHIAGELQQGRMVGFFADQYPRHGGIPGVFFGHPVQIASGPAIYAKRYGAPIVLLTLVSRPDGTHVARCEGPIGAEGTLEDISARWMGRVEARIREHPEQWLWMHRRWR